MAAAGTLNLDLSLDDLIVANASKTQRWGRGRGGGRNGNSRGNSGGGTIILGGGGGRPARNTGRAVRKAMAVPYAVPSRQTASASEGSKIMVSNLHFNVTEADLKELFSTQVGLLRKVMLSFDKSGRSRGIAEVIFRSGMDAAIAYQRFNGVTLDGRPMKIEIVLQPGQIRRNVVVGGPTGVNGGGNGRSSARGRGRARTERGGRNGRNNRPQKTAEELDAEMTAYMTGTADKPGAIDADISM